MLKDHILRSVNSRIMQGSFVGVLTLGVLSACTSVTASGSVPHMTSIVADLFNAGRVANLLADMPVW